MSARSPQATAISVYVNLEPRSDTLEYQTELCRFGLWVAIKPAREFTDPTVKKLHGQLLHLERTVRDMLRERAEMGPHFC